MQAVKDAAEFPSSNVESVHGSADIPDSFEECIESGGYQFPTYRTADLEKAKAAAIFSGDDSQGYKYAFGSLSADIRPYGRQLNEALRGRGGGAADCVQGSVSASGEQIRDFFARLVL